VSGSFTAQSAVPLATLATAPRLSL
jgi:hypothetical protein